MRVVLAHPYSWPEVRRGGERVLHDLAWALRQLGDDVEIVTGTPQRSWRDEVDHVPVARLRHREWLDRRGLLRYDTFGLEALPWLARRRADVVVALSPTAAVASRLAGRRTVFATMGWPTADYWAYRPAEARAFRMALRLAHASTVLSGAARDSVEGLTGVRPTVVPPGVRLADFPATSTPRPGPPVVLFASWAEERGKGLDLLVRAFAALLERLPEARLHLAGGGDPAWALQGLDTATARRVRDAVDVVGDQRGPITAETYGAAHVTVLPSQMESFGLVLLESLACGTPAVGSAAGGIVDVLAGCEVARLVPHGDVARLEASLYEGIALAADPATSAAARAHAARFDWLGVVGPRHRALYAEVAGNPH